MTTEYHAKPAPYVRSVEGKTETMIPGRTTRGRQREEREVAWPRFERSTRSRRTNAARGACF